jgi:hypothetical protein
VTNNEHLWSKAQPKQNEAILFLGMVGIVELYCILVIKHGASLFKRHPMILFIGCSFFLIPLETKLFYMYIVRMKRKKTRDASGAERSGSATGRVADRPLQLIVGRCTRKPHGWQPNQIP